MAIYALNMTHSAVQCPLFNDETRGRFKEAAGTREAAPTKYGVKVLSGYVATLEHLILYVVEAPSLDAVEGYLQDAGLAFFNNIQVREVRPFEQVGKQRGIL